MSGYEGCPDGDRLRLGRSLSVVAQAPYCSGKNLIAMRATANETPFLPDPDRISVSGTRVAASGSKQYPVDGDNPVIAEHIAVPWIGDAAQVRTPLSSQHSCRPEESCNNMVERTRHCIPFFGGHQERIFDATQSSTTPVDVGGVGSVHTDDGCTSHSDAEVNDKLIAASPGYGPLECQMVNEAPGDILRLEQTLMERPVVTSEDLELLKDLTSLQEAFTNAESLVAYTPGVCLVLGEGGRELLRACLGLVIETKEMQGADVPSLLKLAFQNSLWPVVQRICIERKQRHFSPLHRAFIEFKNAQVRVRRMLNTSVMPMVRDDNGIIQRIVYDPTKTLPIGKEGRNMLRTHIRQSFSQDSEATAQRLKDHEMGDIPVNFATVQQLIAMAWVLDLWYVVEEAARCNECKALDRRSKKRKYVNQIPATRRGSNFDAQSMSSTYTNERDGTVEDTLRRFPECTGKPEPNIDSQPLSLACTSDRGLSSNVSMELHDTNRRASGADKLPASTACRAVTRHTRRTAVSTNLSVTESALKANAYAARKTDRGSSTEGVRGQNNRRGLTNVAASVLIDIDSHGTSAASQSDALQRLQALMKEADRTGNVKGCAVDVVRELLRCVQQGLIPRPPERVMHQVLVYADALNASRHSKKKKHTGAASAD